MNLNWRAGTDRSRVAWVVRARVTLRILPTGVGITERCWGHWPGPPSTRCTWSTQPGISYGSWGTRTFSLVIAATTNSSSDTARSSSTERWSTRILGEWIIQFSICHPNWLQTHACRIIASSVIGTHIVPQRNTISGNASCNPVA